MNAATADAARRSIPLTIILGLVTAIGPLTIDLYLPSLPLLENELGGALPAELTLGGTVVGLGIGQFLAGTLSDRFGRRTILLSAVAIHILTAVACALAPSMLLLIIARVLMGIASAGGAVVAIAIVRDGDGGRGMLRALAALAVVSGVAPLVAPVVGSQLLFITDWRGIFLILGGYSAVVLLIAAMQLPESLPPLSRITLATRSTWQAAKAIMRSPAFVGLVLVSTTSWSALFTHLASAPLIMTTTFGLAPTTYGPVFVVFAVAYVGGVQLSARLGSRVSIPVVLSIGLALQAAGGALVLATSGAAHLAVFVGSASVVVAGTAMCLPTVQTLALEPHGKRAGLAASILGGISLTCAGATMTAISAIGSATPAALGVALASLGVTGLALFFWLVRPGLRRR